MAVVQYTAVVNQLRGKLNGSTFNKARNSFTLQKKQQPPKGARGNQSGVRGRYSEVQRSWSGITPAQQNAWSTAATNNPSVDRFGQQTILSGYNQYIKGNLYRLSFGLDLLAVPYSATENVSVNELDIFSNLNVATNQFGETIMSGTASYGGQSNAFSYLVLEVSVPVSTGVTVYHTNWRRLGSNVMGSFSTVFDFETNLGQKYPAMAPGMVLWLAYSRVGIRQGARSPRVIRRLVIPEPPVISSWVVTYNGIGVASTFDISYDPAAIGVPAFYQIRVYFTPASNTPPPASAARTFADTVSEQLQTANHAEAFVSISPGQFVGYRVDIVFTQTGLVVATDYRVVQG